MNIFLSSLKPISDVSQSVYKYIHFSLTNFELFSTKPDREQSRIKEKGILMCSIEHLNIEVNTNKILCNKFRESLFDEKYRT